MMSHPKHVLSSLKNELQKHRVVHQSNEQINYEQKNTIKYNKNEK